MTSQIDMWPRCGCLFFAEPKAPRLAISIPMTPASVRRPSVRQHFQTSSTLKPQGQLNSNFIWRLLRMGEQKFVQMVLVTWPRWPPCPIYGKNPLKIFFSRTRRRMTLGLGMAFQVCSNDGPRLTLTYLKSRSNLLPNAFKWEFFWKDDFLKTVEAKVIIITR